MSESYYSTLDPPSRNRYNEKTELIESKNPYPWSENEFSVDFDNFPSVSYPDIVNYLVFRPSPYSAEDMKAYIYKTKNKKTLWPLFMDGVQPPEG